MSKELSKPAVFWVLFDAEADQKYIKKSLVDGSLAFFDAEHEANRSKRLNPGTDYKRVEYYSAPIAERASVYVECRQCDECQHGGINDSASGLAACHDCDWAGPEPTEDKCPGCQSENCMAAACPKCGARYVLVASDDITAPIAPAT